MTPVKSWLRFTLVLSSTAFSLALQSTFTSLAAAAEDVNAADLEKCCPSKTAKEGAAVSTCSQPGRIESARELLAEGKDFKLNASQTSVSMQDAIKKARGLSGQAGTLSTNLKKAPPGALDQYKRDLGAFSSHVGAYKAHLEQVEKELGHCKSSEKAYAEHLRKYSLHTDQFHIPNIPPPHICEELQISEAENARLANQLKIDRERLAQAEMSLAESEAQLKDSLRQNQHADQALLKRSRMLEEERKLAGEFETLKTELDLLNSQHRALTGGKTTPSLGLGKVSGKVKGK